MKFLLVLVAVLATAHASCPNACSGHGTCDALDRCTCYTGKDGNPLWTGADCSEMTCFQEFAWADVTASIGQPEDATNQGGASRSNGGQSAKEPTWHSTLAHQSAECSNQGSCDRKSGECKCFDNYEGKACTRTVCPESCSGHGVCLNEREFAEDNTGVTYGATEYNSAGSDVDTLWDAEKMQGCLCDAGYRGPDCALVECPTTDDVMNGFGAADGRDCSGRGVCDYSSGLCECFSGFTGTACEKQTVLL